jgi:hypothetical protein
MRAATTVAQMTLRGAGVLLIVLGVTFWTGHAVQLVPVHEFLGFVLVLSLWTLAGIAARAGVSPGLVVLAVVWGLIAPALGLAQDRILTGDWHWTIQVLHLLVGLGAMGQGEGLAARIRQKIGTSPQAVRTA